MDKKGIALLTIIIIVIIVAVYFSTAVSNYCNCSGLGQKYWIESPFYPQDDTKTKMEQEMAAAVGYKMRCRDNMAPYVKSVSQTVWQEPSKLVPLGMVDGHLPPGAVEFNKINDYIGIAPPGIDRYGGYSYDPISLEDLKIGVL